MNDSPEFLEAERPITPEDPEIVLKREQALLNTVTEEMKEIKLPEGIIRTSKYDGPSVKFTPYHFDGLGHGNTLLRKDENYLDAPKDEYHDFLKQAEGMFLWFGAMTDSEIYPLVDDFLKKQQSDHRGNLYLRAGFTTTYITDGKNLRKFCTFPPELSLPESYKVIKEFANQVGIPGGKIIERPFKSTDLERVDALLGQLERINQLTVSSRLVKI